MSLTILTITVLVVLVILLSGTAAFATSKRIDAEAELFWWKQGQQSLVDREDSVAGWDEELHWMLHDETWVPTQDPHQGG